MNCAKLLVRCLEKEGVRFVFGVPGEENLALMEALRDSAIRFVTTRHEQGAAFMADVHGRLTGRPGVCLSTLGPGATNLMTAVADANMDHAPLVAITGQASLDRMHKESHQYLDLVSLFRPVTKWNALVQAPATIPEIVRKAFKVASSEKPGAVHIDLPEDVAERSVEGLDPLEPSLVPPTKPHPEVLQVAADLIRKARRPIILSGNGVIRSGACQELRDFCSATGIGVAHTFMGKGCVPHDQAESLMAVGLQSRDYVSCGFDAADLVLAIGYDIVEYHPRLWNPEGTRRIVHIDRTAAEIDRFYNTRCEVIGDIGETLCALTDCLGARKWPVPANEGLRRALMGELEAAGRDDGFPVKPQRIVAELRRALAGEDIVISDVGAHKMWLARMYACHQPNTCIISNGFASMGIALPGAIAAKLVFPEHKVVAATGDGGFLMNCQELETAVRERLPLVILIFNDNAYGLIEWKQRIRYGRQTGVKVGNPDFVRFAESFGALGLRVERASDLGPMLRRALGHDGPVVIDCPVDYEENLKLTERLGKLVCQI
ncbi:MAG: acetolactate synthase large subunit [Desulfuromonas sp.]|uniref:acetolactate synthase large subunit n=1 Tax=Desulfuromonas sp. TaxID=892 RepID=UPI000CB01E6A|nr:acetolactate synthase large subunit [Desulfuromonas sp.]PLX85664.1 MAG: acetolactate synthase large subunit [Desulfuromonas sp.]